MRVDRNDAWTGLFVLVGLAAMVALVWVSDAQQERAGTYSLRVHVANLDGLAPGTKVTLLGHRVGQVETTELVQEGVELHGVATIAVERRHRVWQGTRATVVSKGLVDSALELALPPVAERRTVLAEGSMIEGAQGPTIADLVAQADATLASLRIAADGLSKVGLNGLVEQPSVQEVLNSLKRTLAEYEALGRDARAFAAQGGRSLGELDHTLGALRGDMDNVDAMIKRREPDLARALNALPDTLAQFKQLAVEVRGAVATVEPHTNASLGRLEKLLASTEQLVEILKQKPSRMLWGKPSEEERERAKRSVESPSSNTAPRPSDAPTQQARR